MPKPKIDRVKLDQMLGEGKLQREIAQYFGVTDGSISKAKNELKVVVVKNVALESAHKVVDKHLDTIGQLQKINENANELLDLYEMESRGRRGASNTGRSCPESEGSGFRGRDHRVQTQKSLVVSRRGF
jgi:Zn-dependent peptidase ImmA (M78 family)